MNIQPANRVNSVEEYYFSRKLEQIREMNEEGVPVINLGIGNPDLPPSVSTIEKLIESSQKDNSHGYQSYIGIPALRKAYSNWYSKHFKVKLNPADEILPLMGSKEGVMHISMAFLNPGDAVLIPNPGYPAYSSATKIAGGEVVYYDLLEKNNWQPDFEKLEQMDLSRIKLMWVNYPNMPTGARATMDLFRRLVEFGKKHGILICNDNPYSFIQNDEQLSLLAVDGAKEVAIELNSMSKSHNMAGWRMGMVAAKHDFIQYILRIKSNMDSGMFLPLQEAAAVALDSPEEWYAEINKHYTKRREIACKIFEHLGCTYDHNQVGMFLWGAVPDKTGSAEHLT
ncbi:MAG: aminotransferase class I/II-fold pyridoxal phosphate-dependent enzyme, partial [Bacteroidota bacterium]|nr:aminotransferase class I/II-fold pyridoxal phosphate-dependent enzyme [Bacteroidota bacterium]